LEIASCSGNISIKETGELVVHGHIAVSDSEGVAHGGHVMEGCIIAATVEVVLLAVESGKLERKFDETMNLWLWNK
jgi:predicted DNA-binding protein with PD1-like motif